MTQVDFSKMTPTEMLAALTKMQADNERLVAAQTSRIRFSVSQKGAISVYGLGRFPLTLHVGQWANLFASEDTLKAFIESHSSECTKQAAAWQDLAEEAKAKGLPSAKVDDYVREVLISQGNKYVKLAKEQAE